MGPGQFPGICQEHSGKARVMQTGFSYKSAVNPTLGSPHPSRRLWEIQTWLSGCGEGAGSGNPVAPGMGR